MRAKALMGASPEKHFSVPDRQTDGPVVRPRSTEPMGTSESSKISLLTTAQKAPAWRRSIFNLDSGFRGLMTVAGLTIPVVVALTLSELLQRSALAWQKFGFHFFATSSWDPVAGEFGALPFIFGTLVSSILALLIAVPLSVAVAVFVTEMSPKPLRKPISFATELLAAISSDIHGL